MTDVKRTATTRLTTTSYAILGVLAIKPRTAYELATEMRHCFEYFWPRDDKRVYADAARLAESGLAETRVSWRGRRRQTTYRITPAGEAALRQWLRAPSSPVGLEFEALVKVFLARFGTVDDLAATVKRVGQDAAFMLQVATIVRGAYVEGCAPFQDEYVHVWAFVYDFLTDYFALLRDWAARTEEKVQSWVDLDPDDKREQALDVFRRKEPRPAATATGAVPTVPGAWRRHAEEVLGARRQSSGADG
jgi:DNA-binding PadR family transcriptional regulator